MDMFIVTGGKVDRNLLQSMLSEHEDACIIGVDRGLDSLYAMNIIPGLAIGDFDSCSNDTRIKLQNNTKKYQDISVLNSHKDLTDTHVAILKAIEKKPDRIYIFGGTGSRIDHMMANINMLKLCLDEGIEAYLIDTCNRIRMIDKHCIIKKDEQYGNYVSCLPFSDTVKGVCLKGFEYPLYNAAMIKADSIGVSNEIREEEGHIIVGEGYLLVMETKD